MGFSMVHTSRSTIGSVAGAPATAVADIADAGAGASTFVERAPMNDEVLDCSENALVAKPEPSGTRWERLKSEERMPKAEAGAGAVGTDEAAVLSSASDGWLGASGIAFGVRGRRPCSRVRASVRRAPAKKKKAKKLLIGQFRTVEDNKAPLRSGKTFAVKL